MVSIGVLLTLLIVATLFCLQCPRAAQTTRPDHKENKWKGGIFLSHCFILCVVSWLRLHANFNFLCSLVDLDTDQTKVNVIDPKKLFKFILSFDQPLGFSDSFCIP